MAAKKEFGSSLGSYIKLGFGVGIGSFAAFILYLLVAMCFFIPGFVLYIREAKKPEAEQSKTLKIVGIVLMALGCLIGLGFGAGFLLEAIGDML